MRPDKLTDELKVLRSFIDFVNRQVGVYCDCLSGFEGNRVRVERQVAIVNRPKSRRVENGQPVVVWESVEDPTSPDVIHSRVIRSDEFMSENSEAGFNEQQVCWAIVVFIFSRWDEDVRPRLAEIRGVEPNDIQVDAMGDIRVLRRSIVHAGGILSPDQHAKLRVLGGICTPGSAITPTHDQMHAVFVAIKKAIGALILDHTGHLPGAPSPEEIVDVAIQNVTR